MKIRALIISALIFFATIAAVATWACSSAIGPLKYCLDGWRETTGEICGAWEVRHHWSGRMYPITPQALLLFFMTATVLPQATSWDPVHWMLWNIPAAARRVAENAPEGMKLADGTNQGKNFGGTYAYRGSNPPPGDVHHMIFDFYALDQQLALSPDATRADLMKAMDGHVIGRTVLIATYQK